MTCSKWFLACLLFSLPAASQVFNPLASNGPGCTAASSPPYCSAAQPAITTNPANTGAQTFTTDPVPANLSIGDIRTLLYPLATPKVLFHMQDWWGCSGHMNIGQTGSNSSLIAAQAGLMLGSGGYGVVMDWAGNRDAAKACRLGVTNAWASYLTSSSSALHMGIMIDESGLTAACPIGATDRTTCLTTELDALNDYIHTNYTPLAWYLTDGGRPMVFYFIDETDWSGTDWATVWSNVKTHTNAYATPFKFIFEDSQTHTQGDGGYAWMANPQTFTTTKQLWWGDSAGTTPAYYNTFYAACLAHPSNVCVAMAKKGFDDGIGFGGGFTGKNRVQAQRCGQTWLDTANLIGTDGFSSSTQLGYLGVPYNDYEEGTEVETGIDPCFTASVSVGTSTLSYILSKTDATYSTLSTLDRLQVLTCSSTTSCQIASGLGSIIPALSGSVSLATLPPGPQLVCLQAVGKPLIRNVLSNCVSFTPASSAPSTYTARVDTCEQASDIYNGISCGLLGLTKKFQGRPGDPTPNLGGPTGSNTPGQWGGTVGSDPDFGTLILRATDFNDAPCIGLASGGNNSFFERKSRAFFYTNCGGNERIKLLDPVLFRVKNSQIQGKSGAGDATHISGGLQGNHGISWAATEDYVFYEAYQTLNAYTINKVTYNPDTDTLTRAASGGFPFQLVGTGNCLPAGYNAGWVGTFNTSADDSTAGWPLSTKNSQGTGFDIVSYRMKSLPNHPGMGCRYLNTQTYAIVGDYGCSYIAGNLAAGCVGPANAPAMSDDPLTCGALPLPCKLTDAGFGPILIHDANQTNNPDFLYYSGPGDGDDGAGTVWEVPTNLIRSCSITPGCAGHGAKGYNNVFRGGKVLAISYQHPILNGQINTAQINGLPAPQNYFLGRLPDDPTVGFCDDAHGTNNQQDIFDSKPVFFGNTAVPSITNGSNLGYPCAYYNEEVAIPTNGSGIVYRFASNFNSGAESIFAQQNAIPINSADGLFMMWLTDCMGTCGCLDGTTNCPDLLATNIWMGDTPYPTGTNLIVKSSGMIWSALVGGTSQHGQNSPLDKARLPATITSLSEIGTTVTVAVSPALDGWTNGEVVTINVSNAPVSGYNGTFDNATVADSTHVSYTATTSGLTSTSGGILYNAAHDNGMLWANFGGRLRRGDVVIGKLSAASPSVQPPPPASVPRLFARAR